MQWDIRWGIRWGNKWDIHKIHTLAKEDDQWTTCSRSVIRDLVEQQMKLGKKLNQEVEEWELNMDNQVAVASIKLHFKGDTLLNPHKAFTDKNNPLKLLADKVNNLNQLM